MHLVVNNMINMIQQDAKVNEQQRKPCKATEQAAKAAAATKPVEAELMYVHSLFNQELEVMRFRHLVGVRHKAFGLNGTGGNELAAMR